MPVLVERGIKSHQKLNKNAKRRRQKKEKIAAQVMIVSLK
jgi:hypothetical protein